ncbi:MAG: hypothetical protein M9916_10470 [Crocinitomicaceae bacterium]|nr:hypothetical protein [Crocinitomicaceae bacterium]
MELPIKNKITYILDDKEYSFSIKDADFSFGENVILSTKDSDISFDQKWYKEGFSSIPFLTDDEFYQLKNEITQNVKTIISSTIDKTINNFSLEDYHKYVSNEDEHFQIVSKTRDLFQKDISFNAQKLIAKFESILNCSLTDIVPGTNHQLHIIIRINRPFSKDYNPPHKDIYEFYDGYGLTPKMINVWIPIAGVSNKSSLPIAPSSHLLTENKILRTKAGSVFEDNQYRVNTIKSWNNQNELIRSNVKYNEALLFSPYLVHGLALNEQENSSRVALELRLFEVE